MRREDNRANVLWQTQVAGTCLNVRAPNNNPWLRVEFSTLSAPSNKEQMSAFSTLHPYFLH
jgi:hypothetical protein